MKRKRVTKKKLPDKGGTSSKRPISKLLRFGSAAAAVGFFLCFGFILIYSSSDQVRKKLYSYCPNFHEVTRLDIVDAIGTRRITTENLRDSMSVGLFDNQYEVVTTIDLELQERMERLYRRYNPMYAAFVAIDPDTGAILAMVDHSEDGHEGNLNLRGSYPAASVFKVVTSAAALEVGNYEPQTKIPFNGSQSSLYKRNLTYQTNRWTRFVNLGDALAKSINTIFGKVAIYGVGREKLQRYADAFGFNQKMKFDMPVEVSSVIVPDDWFGIAESGSGYTKTQTLSPIQGALIAATIINDGETPDPYIVRSLLDEDKEPVYEHAPTSVSSPISKDTASKLQAMMEKTILRGTARRHYRDYYRHPILSKVFIGAKTGSLTGNNPRGKYDWFVGFARSRLNPKKKLAFASMIINGKYWRVKSSYLAREAILKYFADSGESNSLSKQENGSN